MLMMWMTTVMTMMKLLMTVRQQDVRICSCHCRVVNWTMFDTGSDITGESSWRSLASVTRISLKSRTQSLIVGIAASVRLTSSGIKDFSELFNVIKIQDPFHLARGHSFKCYVTLLSGNLTPTHPLVMLITLNRTS